MSAVAAARQAVKRCRFREFEASLSHQNRFGHPPKTTPPIHREAPWRVPNPFVPWCHPKNGKWYQPKYSLRRQVELVKKAGISGTLHLLPPGLKTPKYVPQPVETPAPTPEVAKTSVGVAEEDVVKKRMSIKKRNDNDLSQAPFDWYVGRGREEREEAKVKKLQEKPGAELGTRLYAGKKHMFKGHKWERVKAHRERRQNILMRDMAKRVYNYKNVSFFLRSSRFLTD
jgi:large subunit ribosomal protein L25